MIQAILTLVVISLQLEQQVRQNKRKSQRLLECLKSIEHPLRAIDQAQKERIEVSHLPTLVKLLDVVEKARALLQRQTDTTPYVLKVLKSSKVRDEFVALQQDLQLHMEALNLSVGVLARINQEDATVMLTEIEEQGTAILSNQSTMLNEQGEMKKMLANLQLQSGEVQAPREGDHEPWLRRPSNYEKKKTPLHWAAEEGNARNVQMMLWAGFYIDYETNHDWTPLHFAVQKGHLSVVHILLQHGANIHAVINDILRSTAVHVADINGHENVLKILLDCGAEKSYSEISLHTASEKGDEQVIKVLLEIGANVNKTKSDGESSLHVAAENGHATDLVTGRRRNQPDQRISIWLHHTTTHCRPKRARYRHRGVVSSWG